MTLENEVVVRISTDIQEKTDSRTELFHQAVMKVSESHVNAVIEDNHILWGLMGQDPSNGLSREEKQLLSKLCYIQLETIQNKEREETELFEDILYFFRLITYGKVKIDVSQKDLKNLLKYIPQKMCKDGEMEEFQKHVEGKKNVVKNIFNF